MSKIWNEFYLKKPPFITLSVKKASFVAHLHPALTNYFKRDQEQVKEFDYTAALLSRLMARRKNSFRHMIGFRAVCKLNAALGRLLRLDLTREIENFRSTLPDIVLSTEDSNEVASRHCLDYLLVRLVGAHHIHLRINACCLQAAAYFLQLLRNNFFFEISALFMAVLAKLFTLNMVKDNKCVELYNALFRQRNHFPEWGKHASFSEMEFPKTLEKLAVMEISAPLAIETQHTIVEISSPLAVPPASHVSLQAMAKNQNEQPDLGVALCRKTKKPIFDVSQLANVKDVQKFIKMECIARKKTKKDCLSKKVLNHEWLAVVKLFERKVNANEDQKAVNIFRKFLSSKL